MYDRAEEFNTAEAIREITKQGKMYEVCEIHTFKGVWQDHEVTITIRDYGPNCSNAEARYCCDAVRGKDERAHTGNPAGSIGSAIANIHWRTIHA